MGFGKYLIVGGTGGIGSALTKRLMQKGYQVGRGDLATTSFGSRT